MSQMKKGIIAIAMVLGAVSAQAQQALVSTNTPTKLIFRLTKLEGENYIAQQYKNGSVISTDTTTLDEFAVEYNGYKVISGNLEQTAREYAEANSTQMTKKEQKEFMKTSRSSGNSSNYRYYRTIINGKVYSTTIYTSGNTTTIYTN